MKWVSPGEENPCRLMSELDYDELCDGIRETVRRLIASGFRTAMSSDGTFARELTPIDGMPRQTGCWVLFNEYKDDEGATTSFEKLCDWCLENFKPESLGTDHQFKDGMLVRFTPHPGVGPKYTGLFWQDTADIELLGLGDKDLK